MLADFNLDFYTEVQDLSYLEHSLERSTGTGPRGARFKALNKAICDIVEDFGLVNFETLAVEDKESMFHLLRILDKATGYIYAKGYDPSAAHAPDDMGLYEPGSVAASGMLGARNTAAPAEALFGTADRGSTMGWGGALDVQERWVDHRSEWDEWDTERAKEEGALYAEQKIRDAAARVQARQQKT